MALIIKCDFYNLEVGVDIVNLLCLYPIAYVKVIHYMK